MSSNLDKNKKESEKIEFQDGETVLCYHGPLLYEAKCLKTETNGSKSPQYLIHYSGWNKNWDEWVPRERILKHNEENIRKQKELQETQAASTAKQSGRSGRNSRKRGSTITTPSTPSATATTSANNSSTSTENDRKSNETSEKIEATKQLMKSEETKERKRRTKVEEVKDDEPEYTKKHEFSIKLNEDLKQFLIEDCYTITNENKLVTLPCDYTIDIILNDYLNEKIAQQNDRCIYMEFILGIKDLFEATLNTKLLYKFERLQYSETLRSNKNESKKAAQLYGFIHLLRFFVKIHECFSYSEFDDVTIKQIQGYINDLIRFLNENQNKYYNNKDYYYNPNLVYIQKASSII